MKLIRHALETKTIEPIKKSLKTKFPKVATLARTVLTSLEGKPRIRDTFDLIYKTNGFGGRESVSGEGSSLEQTVLLRKTLPPLLRSIGANTMLDAPCGDHFWMKELALDLEAYIGVDIVRDIVEQNQRNYGGPKKQFMVKDITQDTLPSVDCILCRDCLDHLSFEHGFRALRNFRRSGARYLLATTYTARTKNNDIITGRFRPTNLNLAPFSFPSPLQLINEGCTEDGDKWSDKSLGVWRIGDLPAFTAGLDLR